jgi:HAD superfamily hydrolase (TIGR01509 family)
MQACCRLDPAALVLDMDGLLVDSEPLWHEVECAVARAHGGRWTAELSLECIGTGLAATARIMQSRLGLALTESEAVGELVETFLARVGELQLKPGGAELLEAACGRVRLALASSSTRAIVQAVLRRFDLDSKLEVVVSGSEVANPKPAPDVFQRAAERLGLRPSRCAALEDSLAGVRAARAAGMTVVAVPEHPGSFSGLADFVVADLHEVRSLLGWLPPPGSP